jgi:Lrp/AsnC family leucine-responsive transcriptional regulator
MDPLDRKIIRLLARSGRLSWADLAAELDLSPPAAAERVRKLEQRGIIRGYAALLDAELVGAGVTAFVAIRLERPRHRAAFLARVAELDEILECHHVAGDDDYLLKVRVGSLRDLERFVSDDVKGLAGVAGSRTIVALSTVKETPTPPLPPERG